MEMEKEEVAELVRDSLASMSEEERRALIDQDLGWRHPGRVAQRWIAGGLFVVGSIWAVSLVLSLFILVGIVANVIFIFGWLIYGGWFHVMLGKRMSVSLSFFWLASAVVHLVYATIFWTFSGEVMLQWSVFDPQTTWVVAVALSVVGLGCERWAKAGRVS